MSNFKNIFFSLSTITISVFSLFLVGCGAYQSAGTATGAAIGATVGKEKGALVGALIGNYVGSELDKTEERKEHQREVSVLESEKRSLEQQLRKWCCRCNRQVSIRGAQSCPTCGGKLIQEKFCHRCKTIYSPESGYKFCPYCSVKVPLDSR